VETFEKPLRLNDEVAESGLYCRYLVVERLVCTSREKRMRESAVHVFILNNLPYKKTACTGKATRNNVLRAARIVGWTTVGIKARPGWTSCWTARIAARSNPPPRSITRHRARAKLIMSSSGVNISYLAHQVLLEIDTGSRLLWE
jgi:hypothetical protein